MADHIFIADDDDFLIRQELTMLGDLPLDVDGEPVTIDDLSKPGVGLDEDGLRFTCGINKRFPNLYNPPELYVPNCFRDMIRNFKDGDYGSMYKNAKASFEYEYQIDRKSVATSDLSKSERNVETSVLHDDKIPFKKFDLINPSIGSLSRLIRTGYRKAIGTVYLISGSAKEYIETITTKNEEFKLKIDKVTVDKIDPEGNYYLSFNASLGVKLGLEHYFGYEPNIYQMSRYGGYHAIKKGKNGIACSYYRKTEERVSVHFYDESRYVYGSDFVVDRYKGKSYFISTFPCMHDIISTEPVFDDDYSIKAGLTETANSLALIGNYTHEDHVISGKNYTFNNNSLITSCRGLDNRWTRVRMDGEEYWKASYIKPIFASYCVFLGKKKLFRKVKHQRDSKFYYKGIHYKEVTSGHVDLVLKRGGDIKYDGDNYSIHEKIPVISSIEAYMNNEKYAYGTYQKIYTNFEQVEDITISFAQMFRTS